MAVSKQGIRVEGAKEAARAFRKLDKDGKKDARQEIGKVSAFLSGRIRSAASSTGDRRTQFVGQSIRSKKSSRQPEVLVGKAGRMPTSRGGRGPRSSDLMFGMEFGSDGTGTDTPTARGGAPGWRFPARSPQRGRGSEGYWMYPTLRREQRRVVSMWQKSLEASIRKWAS